MTSFEIVERIKEKTQSSSDVKHLEVMVEMHLRAWEPFHAEYDSYALFAMSLELEGSAVLVMGDYGTHYICNVEDLPTYSML